jgi:hypothetical protein
MKTSELIAELVSLAIVSGDRVVFAMVRTAELDARVKPREH